MPVTIPDEILAAAHISEPELKQELGFDAVSTRAADPWRKRAVSQR
jgi:hypothetical protein